MFGIVISESYKGKPDGHIFKPGDKVEINGMIDYPELNGEIVTISSIRIDGEHGRTYYIKDNDTVLSKLNWIYEYRLKGNN